MLSAAQSQASQTAVQLQMDELQRLLNAQQDQDACMRRLLRAALPAAVNLELVDQLQTVIDAKLRLEGQVKELEQVEILMTWKIQL